MTPQARLLRLSSVAVFLVLLGFLSLGAALQISHRGAGTWLSAFLVFMGLPWVVLALGGFNPPKQTTLWPLSPHWFAIGFVLGVVNFFAWVVPTQALMQSLVPDSLFEQFQSTAIFAGLPGWEVVLVSAGVMVAAPVCEEFFFRGLLQRTLGLQRGASVAIGVSAVVFSAFHFDPVGFPARLQLGLLFGLLAWRSGSLWAAIGAHAANNLVSVLGFALSGGAAAGDEHLSWHTGLGLWVAGNIVLIGLGVWAWRRGKPNDAMAEQAPQSFAEASWPFFAGLLLIGSLTASLDWRAIRLNWFDLAYPAKTLELTELRAQSRRGEIPLADYLERRRAASASAHSSTTR